MRLNIEDTFFASARGRRLEKLLGWNEFEVLGMLALLWHDSQLELCYNGTRKQILYWSRVIFIKPEDCDKLIEALLECDFIRQVNEDLFYICGNENQVDGLRKRSKGGVKGQSETPPSPQCKDQSETPPSPRGKGKFLVGGKGSEKKHEKQLDKRVKDEKSENSPALLYSTLHSSALHSSALHSSCSTQQDSHLQDSNRIGSDKSSPTPSKKNGVPAIWKARITTDDKQLAKQWFDRAVELTPKSKYSLEKFEEALCRIRFDYKFTHEHMVQLFEFIKGDDFWKGNVVSPSSLLRPSKSEPEITKLMQVVRAIKNRPKTEEELLEESFARRRAKEREEPNWFDDPIDVESSYEIP